MHDVAENSGDKRPRKWLANKTLLPTISRFGIVGCFATITYLVSSNALILLHIMPGPLASVAGYLVGMLVSYGGQSRFTFRVGRGDSQQPIRFVVMSACGIGLSYLCVVAAVDLFHVRPSWGTIAAAIIVPVVNFLMMMFWVFKPQRQSRKTSIYKVRFLNVLTSLLIPDIGYYPKAVSNFIKWSAAVSICLWGASLAFMATVPLSGDETFYAGSASAIARFLVHGDISLNQTAAQVVGFGWFMPGVSFALLPVYIFDQTPWQPIIRLFSSLVTLALWAWAVREVYRAFGLWCAAAIIIFPPFALTWLFFTSTIWGDLAGGLMLAIAAARTWSLARGSIERRALQFRKILCLEMVLLLMVYLRGSAIAIVLAIHVFLLVISSIYGKPHEMGRRLAPLVIGIAIFALGLVPWSIAASKVLGGRVITTTTPVLSFGITFGDSNKLCFGPCPPHKNIWVAAANFSRNYASDHGIGELEAQKLMVTNALNELSARAYLEKVRRNFRTFTLMPEKFATRFLTLSVLKLNSSEIRFGEVLSKIWTRVFYFPFFLAFVFVNFAIFRKAEDQVASLIFKMFSLCIFLQPFDHLSHPRYWPAFAVLMGLSGGSLAKHLWSLPQEPAGAAYIMSPQERFLFGIQIAYVALIVVVGAMVLFA